MPVPAQPKSPCQPSTVIGTRCCFLCLHRCLTTFWSRLLSPKVQFLFYLLDLCNFSLLTSPTSVPFFSSLLTISVALGHRPFSLFRPPVRYDSDLWYWDIWFSPIPLSVCLYIWASFFFFESLPRFHEVHCIEISTLFFIPRLNGNVLWFLAAPLLQNTRLTCFSKSIAE